MPMTQTILLPVRVRASAGLSEYASEHEFHLKVELDIERNKVVSARLDDANELSHEVEGYGGCSLYISPGGSYWADEQS